MKRAKEIHSSELTADCMKRVELRLQGKAVPVAQTAMFRGLVAGEVMRILHEKHGIHDPDAPDPALYTPIVAEAIESVMKTLADESRTVSDAVEKSMSEVISDIGHLADAYWTRMRPTFSGTTLLGCEVPVRWSYAPRLPQFASHIDLLYRSKSGALVFADWKLRDTSPTHHYLARNMQFAAYHGSLLEGSVMLNDGLSSEWKRLAEPSVGVWIHLAGLFPFGRKTRCEDDRGFEREFAKGDQRPMRMVWREVEYDSNALEQIRSEIMCRAKMIRGKVFPMNPDPQGCMLCESESFCRRFDMVV